MSTNPELLFFKKWLRSPLTVASVTPSSPQLAKAMACSLPQCDGMVVELGGGTGSITMALLQTGLKPDNLIVIERDPYFYRYLKKCFPEVNVLCGDALHLKAMLNGLFDNVPIRAVVSGLPLLSMNAETQKQLLGQSFSLIDERGIFIQFSYSLMSPLKKRIEKELGLESRCIGYIWRNIPPAKIWVYRSKSVSFCASQDNYYQLVKQQPISLNTELNRKLHV